MTSCFLASWESMRDETLSIVPVSCSVGSIQRLNVISRDVSITFAGTRPCLSCRCLKSQGQTRQECSSIPCPVSTTCTPCDDAHTTSPTQEAPALYRKIFLEATSASPARVPQALPQVCFAPPPNLYRKLVLEHTLQSPTCTIAEVWVLMRGQHCSHHFSRCNRAAK
jgi:hypothetical protein